MFIVTGRISQWNLHLGNLEHCVIFHSTSGGRIRGTRRLLNTVKCELALDSQFCEWEGQDAHSFCKVIFKTLACCI